MISLTDDDPDNAAAVIRYLYTDKVLASGEDDHQTVRNTLPDDPQMLSTLVNVYIAADKFCIQEMCHAIKSLVEEEPLLAWSHIEQLKTAGLRGSAVWDLLMSRIARSLAGERLETKINCKEMLRDSVRQEAETLAELVERMATEATKKIATEEEPAQPSCGLFD